MKLTKDQSVVVNKMSAPELMAFLKLSEEGKAKVLADLLNVAPQETPEAAPVETPVETVVETPVTESVVETNNTRPAPVVNIK